MRAVKLSKPKISNFDFLTVLLFIFGGHIISNAQAVTPGLEGILLEKFYEVNEKDRSVQHLSGVIDEGAITWRIFLDLEPGYRFQAAYGTTEHPLELNSTAVIYNHNGYGNYCPNVIMEKFFHQDILFLDSWFSTGAATETQLAIPRGYDIDRQHDFIRFEKGFLENDLGDGNGKLAMRDGMDDAETMVFPTFYHMDEAQKQMMTTAVSNHVVIEDGAWAAMGKGALGLDSLGRNHLLIAQITPAGDLECKLNIMIGTPDGKSLRYVYANPQENEQLHPALMVRSEPKKKIENQKKKSRK
ncbi:MAG: hypothetical protein ACKOW8_02040 [Flavobacteriales bacterium]